MKQWEADSTARRDGPGRISNGFARCVAIAAAIVCWTTLRAAEQPATPAKAEAAIPRSVFVNDPEVGKDPFFPTSSRRKDALPRVAVVTTNAAPVPSAVFDLLTLRGISGIKSQRLALINSATLAVGETADIKCYGGQIVRIRCREIRDFSVLVELVGPGEVRELKLREGV